MFINERWNFFNMIGKISGSFFPIVFYAEVFSDLLQYKEIIEHLGSEKKNTICIICSDPSLAKWMKKNSLNHLYVPRFLIPAILSKIRCKVFVSSSPYLGELQMGKLRRGCISIYLFHSLNSIFKTYRKDALKGFDIVLLPGEAHEKEFELLYDSSERKKAVIAGYPLFDFWTKKFRELPLVKKNKILFAPTWGKKSLFTHERDFIESLEAILSIGYEIDVRPHPMTLIKGAERRSFKRIKNYFKGATNIQWIEDLMNYDCIFNASLLVTDQSSISMEFTLATLRPSIFLLGFEKVKNDAWESLRYQPLEKDFQENIGFTLALSNLHKEMGQILCINEGSEAKKRILDFKKRILSFEGEATKRIASILEEQASRRE